MIAHMMLFHGGKPGLRPGDLITPGQPHFLDGCKVCDVNRAGHSHPASPLPVNPDRVYLTSDRHYARHYASKWPHGDLYSVEPIGDLLDAGREDPFPTWSVPMARVRGICERYVRQTPSQWEKLDRRWAAADRARGLPDSSPLGGMKYADALALARELVGR